MKNIDINNSCEAEKIVYMCFSTEIIHGGHISIINKAAKLGKLMAGVLSDQAVASYKRLPLISYEERKKIIENIRGIESVVEQKNLSYKENLLKYKPNIVVHGDDWKTGPQSHIRLEVINILNEYGGELIEFPYSKEEVYYKLEKIQKSRLSIPDIRRGQLKRLIKTKKCISIIEAHSGITGVIAENTTVYENGYMNQFDGMWISSLCDSTAKGKPDIEIIDISSRIRTIDDIMEVTTKPIILDGDTGGTKEQFMYNVRTFERMGISAVIIEDKTGLKRNSLLGNDVFQVQCSKEEFCEKIRFGNKGKNTRDFMIIARIESLILEKGIEDALDRAKAYIDAGADGIMIHSREKTPDEIFLFVERFRKINNTIPLVVVPTTYNLVREEEFLKRGVNIIIYANQLIRSGIPAMEKTAETILKNHRSFEAEEYCISVSEMLKKIEEDY